VGLATAADVPVPDAGKYRVATVLLFEGQTALLDEHIYVPFPLEPDYAGVGTGEQINAADAGIPTNPDKFGFWSVGDAALEYITYEDLLALIGAVVTSTTIWEPLANGDPVSPDLIFDGDGDVIMIEVPL
jgi:hypothetical protein